MTNYREILRLHSQRISQRGIAISSSCSMNTVGRVLKRAKDYLAFIDVTYCSLTYYIRKCIM